MTNTSNDLSSATTAAWDRWHEGRLRALCAPDGYLSLTGLIFLDDGTWSIGSDPACQIHVPGASAPRLGTFEVAGDHVRFTRVASAALTVAGDDRQSAELRPDESGDRSFVRDGPRSFALVRRNGRLALRMRDANNPVRTTFDTIDRFPYNPMAVASATIERPSEGSTIAITNVTGFVEEQPLAAIVRGTLFGSPFACAVTAMPGGGFFLVFADQTNGQGTYPGGRFLDISAPDERGVVTLDFNRAYNPACAFTSFATCPTPPAPNRLAVPITAGERYPHRTKEAR